MGILETIFQSATVVVALAGAYLVAFWFVLIVWAYRDIESRSRSVVTQVFSTLMVVLFFVPGVLLYLILRPKDRLDESFQRSLEEEYLLQDLEELPLCPSCHRYVEDDFVLCPQCHAQLREACANCSRLVDLRWALCPYCGTVQGGPAEKLTPVELPAARWTATERRRLREGVREPERVAGTASEVVARELGGTVRTEDALAAGLAQNRGENGEHRALPFTIVSGMRSIVRSAERGRGTAKNGIGDHSEVAAREVESGSAGPQFGPFVNGASSGTTDRNGAPPRSVPGTNGHGTGEKTDQEKVAVDGRSPVDVPEPESKR